MASDPSLPIQKAIYDALTGDATLMGKIEGVYDHVPQNESFPYVSIGKDTASDFSGNTFDGVNADVMINTWARGAGRKECKEIMAEIYRVLHNASLTVTGFTLVLLQFDFSDTELDPDGETYHGVQRFKMIVTN